MQAAAGEVALSGKRRLLAVDRSGRAEQAFLEVFLTIGGYGGLISNLVRGVGVRFFHLCFLLYLGKG